MILIQDLTSEELMKLLFQYTTDCEINIGNKIATEQYVVLIDATIAEIQKRKGWTKEFSIR